ncbi:hypothetical protein SAMN04488540_11556 [Ferrimonas sediminum]|uniref:Sensory transduction regulator n=1 Tax=Ferrimonas sediminum TaxID=718193 RepID=A0A1G8XJU7_9GAMM|nr:hypothetical protein [Ferrimonas sediminum]SDJ90677.1 hypothetical protein SAMN04488540_11556 [Ferrimonas sediminum]
MMKHWMIAAVLVVLTGCASTGKDPVTVDMSGMTNEQATEQLIEALKSESYQVKRASADRVLVDYDGSHFLLQPKLMPNGLDRVVITKYYALHPDLAQTPELLLIIGKLNQQLDFAKFVVRDEGKAIEVRGAATFVDRISVLELTRFMDWTNQGLALLRQQFPQAQPMAKEVRLNSL